MILFTPEQLAAYLQRSPFTQAELATVEIVHELILDNLAAYLGNALTDPLPPGLKAVIFAIAERGMTHPDRPKWEATATVSVTYQVGMRGLAFTEEDYAAIDRALGRAGAYTLTLRDRVMETGWC